MAEVKILEQQADAPPVSKWLNYLIEGTILVLALLLGLTIRWGIYETTIVTSGSMEATIQVRDRLLIDHRSSLHQHWQRGDIIMFTSPKSWDVPDDTLIKRVIALPGETLEIRQGQVFINNQPIKETYLKEAPNQDNIGPISLEPNAYYVMGDNRNNSDDSRNNGPITDSRIEGRAIYRLGPLGRVGGLPAVQY
ncbi:MAG: signal peptidase I [Abitibacteriaceae bacterium]|nr:signal peptidase I [Abditibacteriaceae bacterium]